MVAVPETNVFGPSVGAPEVEAAALATLKTWLPTYIHEMERRTGRDPGTIARVRSWNETSDFSQNPGVALPAVIVVSPGLDGEPERRGNGVYAAWWQIIVGVIVGAATAGAANDLAKLYAEAVRMLFVGRNGGLGDLRARRRWLDESYDDAPPDFKQVATVATVSLAFLVEGVVADGYGPKTPDDDPPDLGQVEEVDIDGHVAWDGRDYTGDPIPLVRRSAP
jgi:hypothetical protein